MGVVRCATGLAVLVAAAACTGGAGDSEIRAPESQGQSQTEPGPADGEAELDWLAGLGAWRKGIDATLWDFFSIRTDRQLDPRLERGDEEARSYVRTFLDEFSACSESFRAEVGPAPTPRLRPGAQAILTACEYLERGAEEVHADLELGLGDPFLDGSAWLSGGRDRIWTSNRQTLLRADGRELMRSDAPEESRIDAGLTDATNAALQLSAFQVEVRCWSEADWPDVVEELSAFTNGTVTLETMAWTSYLVGIHLSPHACAKLEEVQSGDYTVEEDSARPLIAFARALAIFYGFRDAAHAECWGMQAADEVARALGMRRAHGRALSRLYWDRVYPQLTAELRSPECRPGGKFDFDPARPAWP